MPPLPEDGHRVQVLHDRIVVGSAFGATTVARYLDDGTLDASFGTGGVASPASPVETIDESTHLLADGRIMLSGWDTVGAATLTVLGSTTLLDYDASTANWAGTGSNLFGACMVSAVNATVDGSTWPVDANAGADCADGDGDPWQPIAEESSGATAKVLTTDGVGQQVTEAHLRFGVRTSNDQRPGTYIAPITFEVIAPAA